MNDKIGNKYYSVNYTRLLIEFSSRVLQISPISGTEVLMDAGSGFYRRYRGRDSRRQNSSLKDLLKSRYCNDNSCLFYNDVGFEIKGEDLMVKEGDSVIIDLVKYVGEFKPKDLESLGINSLLEKDSHSSYFNPSIETFTFKVFRVLNPKPNNKKFIEDMSSLAYKACSASSYYSWRCSPHRLGWVESTKDGCLYQVYFEELKDNSKGQFPNVIDSPHIFSVNDKRYETSHYSFDEKKIIKFIIEGRKRRDRHVYMSNPFNFVKLYSTKELAEEAVFKTFETLSNEVNSELRVGIDAVINSKI